MDHPIQLRWQGPTAPRAKPVPQEKWEQHKQQLCELYQKMKLDDLITFMRVVHDFSPSRRQYIHQFEKWGFQKYSKAKATSPAMSPKPITAHLRTTNVTGGDVEWSGQPTSSTKRQQSSLSLQSTQTNQSRPPVPPKKKQKLADYMASRDPYAGLGLAFNSPVAHIGDGVEAKPSPNPMSQEPFPPFDRDFGVVDSPFNDPDVEMVDDASNCLDDGSSLVTTRAATVSLFESESHANNDEYPISSRWHRVNEIQNAPRIDSSRLIETYTREDIRDMKQAADYLFCMLFHEDAFPLYTLVLKWLQAASGQSEQALSAARISCARCPGNDAQDEIVRKLLEPSLDETHSGISGIEKFVSRMLLAETYARSNNPDDAYSHVKVALSSGLSINLLEELPQQHRAFDLLVYHNLTRCLRSRSTDELAANVRVEDAPTKMDQYEDMILQRVPGPFELQNEVMRNPCLRSCVRWCDTQLEDTMVMPGIWKAMKNQHSSLKSAQCIALFTWLWHQWQESQTIEANLELELWKHEAEKRMGISPTELLMTVCWVINEASNLTLSKDDYERIAHLRTASKIVLQLPDRALAMEFLENFACRNGLQAPSQERVAFEKVAREHARSLLQKILLIILPEAGNGKPYKRGSQQITVSRLLPTVASSLQSTDFSSLRRLRDRLQEDSGAVMDEIRFGLPSTVFGNGLGSSISILDRLSNAFESSLNISSEQKHMSSSCEMASVGSSITRRVTADEDDVCSQRRTTSAGFTSW